MTENGLSLLCPKRCVIGEGPIWNDREKALYFTNGCEKEICRLDLRSGELRCIPTDPGAAAIAFDERGRMILSQPNGVYFWEGGVQKPLYDTAKYRITHANDMKVGPDGRIYVGTQSEKRLKLSDKVDGKLYSIDKSGTVKVLLDGLMLSNGMDWSMDEKRFYHTDSPTKTIREYLFHKETGELEYTGRSVYVPGVDGFTVDQSDRLLAACWGHSQIAIINTKTMEVEDTAPTPAQNPASCAFSGEDMRTLILVTASYHSDLKADPLAGQTFAARRKVGGRLPYLFSTI